MTVPSLTEIRLAMSALEKRRATRSSTSRSRVVSKLSSALSRQRGGRRLANSSTRRPVTDGGRSTSLAAAARTAATTSSSDECFKRKPHAPALSASNTYSSRL